MKIAAAKPFTFEAGKRAILLLHGFTGTTADVRMLGRFLEKRGILVMLRYIKVMAFRLRNFYYQDLRSIGRMYLRAISC